MIIPNQFLNLKLFCIIPCKKQQKPQWVSSRCTDIYCFNSLQGKYLYVHYKRNTHTCYLTDDIFNKYILKWMSFQSVLYIRARTRMQREMSIAGAQDVCAKLARWGQRPTFQFSEVQYRAQWTERATKFIYTLTTWETAANQIRCQDLQIFSFIQLLDTF